MKLISSGDVARLLGIKIGTLARWRREGKGPSGWVYQSQTRLAYPEEEVKKYIESLPTQRPTPREAA